MKALRFCLMICGIFLSAQSCSSKEQMIAPEALPAPAREFIAAHFPDDNVKLASKKRDNAMIKYCVRLEKGFELEFDRKGEWTEVDGHRQAIPSGVLPPDIAIYTAENFPESNVTGIERKARGYEVKLSNGVELEFHANGLLSGWDD